MTGPEPLPDQWYTRDLVILREVAGILSQDFTTRADIPDGAAALNLDASSVAGRDFAVDVAGAVVSHQLGA